MGCCVAAEGWLHSRWRTARSALWKGKDMISSVARSRSAGGVIEVTIHHFKLVRGVQALAWFVMFAIVFAMTAPDTWHRDMVPTRDWFLTHPAFGGTIVATYGSTTAIALFIVLPIVLNSIASELAAYMK